MAATPRKSLIRPVPFCALLAALALSPLPAQSTYNYNTNADASWSAIQTGTPTAGDTVNLSADLTGNRTITLDITGATVGALLMQDTVASNNNWNITGTNTLTFDNTGSTAATLSIVNSNSGNYMRITAPVQLNDNLQITNLFSAGSGNNTGRFDFDGNINGGGNSITYSGVGAFTYDQAGTAMTNIAGFRHNAVGSATFASATSITNSALGPSFTLGQGLMGGQVTLAAPVTLNSAALNVQAEGFGRILLSGAVAGATDLNITGSGFPSQFFVGDVQGNPHRRNVVYLDNTTANSFSGNTTVTGAALVLNFQAGNVVKINSSGTLTLNAANISVDDASTGNTAQAVAGLTIGAGESNIVTYRNNTGGNVTLNLGAITRNTGGTAVFRYTGGTVGTIGTNSSIITSSSNTNGILGGWALVATGGTNADDFASVGAGGVIQAPSYTTLTAAGGGLGTQNLSYSSGTDLALSGAISANSLRLISSGLGGGSDSQVGELLLNTGSFTVNLASGGLLNVNTGGNSMTTTRVSGTGLIQAADANSDLFVHVRNTRLALENPLIGSGTGALYKTGYGELVVTSNADYTGGTWISGGVFNIGGVDTRLSSGNLRLYQGGQLGTNGTFTRSIGSGAGEVFFGTGGGGFSASGGDLTVNLGGAGATLTKSQINGHISLNNNVNSTGVVTLVNAVDTTGDVTISTSSNIDQNRSRYQSAQGSAYAVLQGGTTGSGSLMVLGASTNAGNTNGAHAATGLIVTNGNLGHTGQTLINGTTLFITPGQLATLGNITLTAGGQIASYGNLNFNTGAGVGEIQFSDLGNTFNNDAGFAAIRGDLTVTLNGSSAGAVTGLGDVILGSAFSGYTTTFTNNISAGGGVSFQASGPGTVIYNGTFSGTGSIQAGNSPVAGVLLVSGANTFTGNASTGGSSGMIYRAGSTQAFGAANGATAFNSGSGTFDLNGYNFTGSSSENFQSSSGNSGGTSDIGRIINSNTTSAASFNNLRLDNNGGDPTILGGRGTLNINGTIDQTAALNNFTSVYQWRGTGTLNLNGSSVLTTTPTGASRLGMGFTGGAVNLNYGTNSGTKLLTAVVGAPSSGEVLRLSNVNLTLNGHASNAVTETIADNGTAGGTAFNGGFSSVQLNTAGANLTLNLNRLVSSNRGSGNFSTNTAGGGAAAITTDTLNNTAGLLGTWATWNRTDWAVNTPNTADGAIGALAAYTTNNDLSAWATGDTTNNMNIDGAASGTLSGNTRVGSLRFNNGGTATSLDLGTSGLSLGASTESGGILVAQGTSGNIAVTGGALNSGGASLGTGDTQGGSVFFIHHHGTGTLDIGSKITGSSNVYLVKNGSGTLLLSGLNTYGNSTLIHGGMVVANSLANSGTSQSLGTGNEVLITNGATLRLANTVDVSTNKSIQLGIGGGGLDLAGPGTTATFNGRNLALPGNTTQTLLTAVYRDANASVPDFTITGAGDAVFNAGIYLSTPVAAENGTGSANAVQLADSASLARFFMNGSGTVTLNDRLIAQGGATVNSGTLVLGHDTDTLSNNAALTVNSGGTVNIASGKSDNIGQLYVKGGTISGTGTLKTLANFVESGTVNANLGGELAGLDKTTSGTATLAGNNTYAGDTRITAGTLIVNGSLTRSNVFVQTGATLGGAGTIGGATVFRSGSFHNPGNSPGLPTFTNDVTYETGSDVNWELVANTTAGRGLSYDGVNITGTGTDFTIQSGVDLNLVFNGSGSTVNFADSFWTANRTWEVVDFTGTGVASGAFDLGTITLDTLGQSHLSYGAFSLDQNMGDVTLVWTSTIPEPSTYAMVLAGLAALAWLRRRQQAARS